MRATELLNLAGNVVELVVFAEVQVVNGLSKSSTLTSPGPKPWALQSLVGADCRCVKRNVDVVSVRMLALR